MLGSKESTVKVSKSPTNVESNEDVLTKLAEKLVQFAKPKKDVIDVEFREETEKQTDPNSTTDRGVSEGIPKESV